MSFLTPLALFGLILVPVLVVLHLRRRRYQVEDVPSLLLWREVLGETIEGGRRFGLLSLPLLLLQILAVVALVGSLARPAGQAGAPHEQVYVLDTSVLMMANDVAPSRLAAAKHTIDQQIDHLPAGTRISVVTTGANPSVLITSTDGGAVKKALAGVQASETPANLTTALDLAAGLLVDPQSKDAGITLVHAREETVPPVHGPSGLVKDVSVGQSANDQAIVNFTVQCIPGTSVKCTAYAALRNDATTPVTDPLVIDGDGKVLAVQTMHLPAQSETGVSFAIPSDHYLLQMYLAGKDILPADNIAWAIVPQLQRTRVVLVGAAASTAPLKQALEAAPGVQVQVELPAKFNAATAAAANLLVLDGWVPGGSAPQTPAVLYVNPPSIPGGTISGTIGDTTLSAVDKASPLMQDVDLTSLDILPGAARQMTLPASLTPIVSTATGPLLAAGAIGNQQVAVLAFDPVRSNLPQLDAFPLLMRNLVQQDMSWLPATGYAGEPVRIQVAPGTTSIEFAGTGPAQDVHDAFVPVAGQPFYYTPSVPGIYTVLERGAHATRFWQTAINLDVQGNNPQNGGAPVQVGTGSGSLSSANQASSVWWPAIGLIALLCIVIEWLYVALRQEG
jgi:hypothetical protein